MASQYVLNSKSLPVFFITMSGSYILIRIFFPSGVWNILLILDLIFLLKGELRSSAFFLKCCYRMGYVFLGLLFGIIFSLRSLTCLESEFVLHQKNPKPLLYFVGLLHSPIPIFISSNWHFLMYWFLFPWQQQVLTLEASGPWSVISPMAA